MILERMIILRVRLTILVEWDLNLCQERWHRDIVEL